MWKTKISSCGLKSTSCPGLSSHLHLKCSDWINWKRLKCLLHEIKVSVSSISGKQSHAEIEYQKSKNRQIWTFTSRPSAPSCGQWDVETARKNTQSHNLNLEQFSMLVILVRSFFPGKQSEVEECYINHSESFNPPHSATQVFFHGLFDHWFNCLMLRTAMGFTGFTYDSYHQIRLGRPQKCLPQTNFPTLRRCHLCQPWRNVSRL